VFLVDSVLDIPKLPKADDVACPELVDYNVMKYIFNVEQLIFFIFKKIPYTLIGCSKVNVDNKLFPIIFCLMLSVVYFFEGLSFERTISFVSWKIPVVYH
jgi:hypothetical protein